MVVGIGSQSAGLVELLAILTLSWL